MRVSEFPERKGGGDGRRLGTTQLKGVHTYCKSLPKETLR